MFGKAKRDVCATVYEFFPKFEQEHNKKVQIRLLEIASEVAQNAVYTSIKTPENQLTPYKQTRPAAMIQSRII
jgi:hypothetical protein